MARCLRCHAGNEWIEGNVPDELSTELVASLLHERTRLRRVTDYILDPSIKRLDRDVLRSLARATLDDHGE